MKIDGKSLLLGAIIGWFITIYRAAVAVAKDGIKE
jgi:hypothetical protein